MMNGSRAARSAATRKCCRRLPSCPPQRLSWWCRCTTTRWDCGQAAGRRALGTSSRLPGNAVSDAGPSSISTPFEKEIIRSVARRSLLATTERGIFRTLVTGLSSGNSVVPPIQADPSGPLFLPCLALRRAKTHAIGHQFQSFPSCRGIQESPATPVRLSPAREWCAVSGASRHCDTSCASIRKFNSAVTSRCSSPQSVALRPGVLSPTGCSGLPLLWRSFCRAENTVDLATSFPLLSPSRHFWGGLPSPSSLSSLLPDVFPKANQTRAAALQQPRHNSFPGSREGADTVTFDRRSQGEERDWRIFESSDTCGRGHGLNAENSSRSSCLRHSERRLVGVTPEEYFSVVKDVARYHEFVPWCKESRIVEPTLERHDGGESFEAELVVGFGLVSDRYTSRVSSVYPRPGPGASSRSSSPFLVTVAAADSTVFKTLVNCWEFHPLPGAKRACSVDFTIEFEFNSSLHQHLAGLFLNDVAATMGRCFDARVTALYGVSVASPALVSSSFSPSLPPPSEASWAPRVASANARTQNEDSVPSPSSRRREDTAQATVVAAETPEGAYEGQQKTRVTATEMSEKRGGNVELAVQTGSGPVCAAEMPERKLDQKEAVKARLETRESGESGEALRAAEEESRDDKKSSLRCTFPLGTLSGSVSASFSGSRKKEECGEERSDERSDETHLCSVLPEMHTNKADACEMDRTSLFRLSTQTLSGSPTPADLAFFLGRLRQLREFPSSCFHYHSSPPPSSTRSSSSSATSSFSSSSVSRSSCSSSSYFPSSNCVVTSTSPSRLHALACGPPPLECQEKREELLAPEKRSSSGRLSPDEERAARQLLLGRDSRAVSAVVALFLAFDPVTANLNVSPLAHSGVARCRRPGREGDATEGENEEGTRRRATERRCEDAKGREECRETEVERASQFSGQAHASEATEGLLVSRAEQAAGASAATVEAEFAFKTERDLADALRDLVRLWNGQGAVHRVSRRNRHKRNGAKTANSRKERVVAI
ncbi:polyketide cyclase/dehydrase [Toxoplasma gondii p89]|uniref:Polyketide cyclase/dehydrase n=1 Tax=Toxoplasma gondii p89 TaxID=943119 RepID=A0A086L3Z1_TOXGO|nr:polyketide cyclase/dehydrase [Toxoplasma gondii p89]